LFFWLEVSGGKLWIESVLTNWKDALRSTLAINSDLSWIISNISNQDHHLLFLAEWDAHHFGGEPVSIDEQLMGGDIVIEEEFYHGDFKSLTAWFIREFLFISLKPYISVGYNCFCNKILHLIYDLKRSGEGFSNILLNLSITELVAFHRHLTFGNSSCLTNANIMKHRTSLDGF
jgi:hypothetical protein